MNYILKIWYMIVGEPHVRKAVKNMEKAVKKVTHAAEFQSAKSAALALAAKAAEQGSKLAQTEAEKAVRVAKKLSDLFEI